MQITSCHSQFRLSSATQNKLQIPNSGPLQLLRPVCPLTHLLFPRHQAPASWILHLTLLLPRAPSSALQTLTFAEASLPPIVNEAVPSRSLKPDLSLLAFHRPERSFLRLGGFPLPLLIPLWGRDPALSTARAPSTAGC